MRQRDICRRHLSLKYCTYITCIYFILFLCCSGVGGHHHGLLASLAAVVMETTQHWQSDSLEEELGSDGDAPEFNGVRHTCHFDTINYPPKNQGTSLTRKIIFWEEIEFEYFTVNSALLSPPSPLPVTVWCQN